LTVMTLRAKPSGANSVQSMLRLTRTTVSGRAAGGCATRGRQRPLGGAHAWRHLGGDGAWNAGLVMHLQGGEGAWGGVGWGGGGAGAGRLLLGLSPWQALDGELAWTSQPGAQDAVSVPQKPYWLQHSPSGQMATPWPAFGRGGGGASSGG
jgi:hypothetical protein